jgi:hypothetical protein
MDHGTMTQKMNEKRKNEKISQPDSVGDKISESHVDMGNERERKTYAEVTKEKTSKQVNETKAVRFIL